jgi:hypothetical protein
VALIAGETCPSASKYSVEDEETVLAGMPIENNADAVAARAVLRRSEIAAEIMRVAAVCSIAVC